MIRERSGSNITTGDSPREVFFTPRDLEAVEVVLQHEFRLILGDGGVRRRSTIHTRRPQAAVGPAGPVRKTRTSISPESDSPVAYGRGRRSPKKGAMRSHKQIAVPRIDVERHRRALLEAAADELARNPDSSMADVAQAANLTRATLYRHFSNRETLLKAIQAEALARASETLIACRLEEGDALEVLRRVIAALGKQGMRFRIILMRAPDHNARFLARRDQVLAPLVEVVKRGQVEGDIRADLSPEWIVAAIASLLMSAVRATPQTKHSDAEVSDLIYRTLVGGITASQPAGGLQN